MTTRRAQTLLLGTLLATAAQGDPSASQAEFALQPHVLDGAVQFECVSRSAERVYLAGTFNNWADNRKGVVSDKRYLMEPVPGRPGVFRSSVRLNPGRHRFRFVLETPTRGQIWFDPPAFLAIGAAPAGTDDAGAQALKPGLDADGNVLLGITPGGRVFLGDGVSPDLAPACSGNTVTFRCWAPEAASVHLAGSFNEWARNREGWVDDPSLQFSGPDEDGIWSFTLELPRGEHRYQFVVNGRDWRPDPNSPVIDGRHSVITLP